MVLQNHPHPPPYPPNMTGFDEIMARASRELVSMDYLACEADCLDALGLARSEGDFTAYRRALRPLQESRRARRMLAADGAVWIGPPPPEGEADADAARAARIIASGAGCCCVSGDPAAGRLRLEHARSASLHAEVLLGEATAGDAGRWAVAAPAAAGGSAEEGLFPAEVEAPPEGMIGVALHPDHEIAGTTPRHWFIAASEAVGDAALAWAAAVSPAGTMERLAALETAVAAVADHELLHQALADAAGRLELAGGGLR